MRRIEVGIKAGRIKSGLVERLGVEVDCSWNDKEITILAFVNNSDYKEFIINAEDVADISMVVDLLEIKYKDKTWEIHEADGAFRDFKTFAEKCECKNIVTWGNEVAWEGVELHRLDYYDSYSVYRANDCYSMTLYDDLNYVKIVVNFSDDEVRVYDLKSKLEIEDYYEIA